MADESGEIKVYNPSKEISTQITLEILIRHRDALKQARTGELVGQTIEQLKDNDRKLNQVRALSLIISAQREMIAHSRSKIVHDCQKKWRNKFREDKEREENPFEKEDNDYNKIIEWKKILVYYRDAIFEAEKSKTLDDDFMVKKQTNDGEVIDLTDNFHDMLEDLEDSYEQIYLLMLKNKIVSAGIEEDEEKSQKELENEFISRVVDA